jgi:tRNA (cytidine/uridine-2'-O-)-methyltransferase
MGFDLDEKKLRRAGLDYGDMAHVTVHTDYWSFKEKFQARRMIACTTKGRGSHAAMKYQLDDILLFGAETHGLSPEVMADIAEANRVKIPMKHGNRSLNLSNAVAIISYEAWRQHDFIGAGE